MTGDPARASVRVGHAQLVVRGSDPAEVVPMMERALVEALEEVGARWPNEWLFVRSVEIELRARTSGEAFDVGAITQAIAAALGRRIERMRDATARTHAMEGVVGDDVAWYPTEGAARGALLRSLLEGRVLEWPCSAMAWARTLDDVEPWSTLELGDALAHAIGHAAETVPIPERVARAWVGRWTSGRVTFDLAALPDEVRARVRAAAASGEVGDVARLRALAHVFAMWPPARDAIVDVTAVDRLTHRAADATTRPLIPSRAGGLAAWAVLARRARLDAALWGGIGDERTSRAARWAVARALEAAEVIDDDPVLRMWAGERADGPPLARWVFDQLDPQPLHRGALRFAQARGWLAGDLVLAPLAGGAALMAGDLCVDFAPEDADRALPALVRRFAAWTGQGPIGVAIESQHAPAVIDSFAEVDVMALPDGWRAAARAAASVARHLLRDEWRLGLRDVRSWMALVQAGTPALIEIPRARAGRLPVDLASEPVELGGRAVRVVLV